MIWQSHLHSLISFLIGEKNSLYFFCLFVLNELIKLIDLIKCYASLDTAFILTLSSLNSINLLLLFFNFERCKQEKKCYSIHSILMDCWQWTIRHRERLMTIKEIYYFYGFECVVSSRQIKAIFSTSNQIKFIEMCTCTCLHSNNIFTFDGSFWLFPKKSRELFRFYSIKKCDWLKWNVEKSNRAHDCSCRSTLQCTHNFQMQAKCIARKKLSAFICLYNHFQL